MGFIVGYRESKAKTVRDKLLDGGAIRFLAFELELIRREAKTVAGK